MEKAHGRHPLDSGVINKHHQSASQPQFLANYQSSSWKHLDQM